MVWATSERFLLAWATFSFSSANEALDVSSDDRNRSLVGRTNKSGILMARNMHVNLVLSWEHFSLHGSLGEGEYPILHPIWRMSITAVRGPIVKSKRTLVFRWCEYESVSSKGRCALDGYVSLDPISRRIWNTQSMQAN